MVQFGLRQCIQMFSTEKVTRTSAFAAGRGGVQDVTSPDYIALTAAEKAKMLKDSKFRSLDGSSF